MRKKNMRRKKTENILSNICAAVLSSAFVFMFCLLFFLGEEPRTDPEYLAMVEQVQRNEYINTYGEEVQK